MPRGPKPLPTELHVRRGTFRPDRHGDVVTLDKPIGRFDAEELKPPAGLGKSGPARDAWNYLAPRLAASGILDRSDMMMLEAGCAAWGRYQQARTEFKANPKLVVQGSKGPITNPLLKIERDALDAFIRIAERFGLDPSSRARLGLVGLQGLSLAEELKRVLDADGDDEPMPVQLPAAPRRATRA